MAGYTRQSVADIIANAIIKAAPVNAEFNTIRDAFAQATGHAHDGTSAEGAYVPLISDTNAFNKVVIDSVNNRISFYNDVSSVAVEQVRIEDGVFVPVTDNDVDLGAVGAEFKDLYIDGIGYIDTLAVHENATITGNLTVSGNTVLGSAATDTVTITADVASTLIPGTDDTYDIGAVGSEWRNLYIDGTANVDSLIADTADINGGTIDGATIGGTTPGAVTTSSLVATTADINAGTVDNTVIGGTTAAAGTFTTATATTGNITTVNATTVDTTNVEVTNIKAKDGTASATIADVTGVMTVASAVLTTADVNGGTIDATTIGATTPAAITGTTVTGTSLVGPVTGNVTGNLAGDVTSTGTSSFGTVTTTGDVTVGGDLTVNGTTTTISTTNVEVSDALMELANGTAGVPTNDSGIVIERGSSDNAFIGFDESVDKFTVGTGTFTGASTGSLITTTGTMVANIEGDVTGDLTGNVSGNVTGNVTGDITSTVSSSFTTANVTGTLTYGSITDGTLTMTGFVDEDNMVSDSATLIPTQQSVKKYVDDVASISNNVTGLTATGVELNNLDASAVTPATVTLVDGDGLPIIDVSGPTTTTALMSDVDTYVSGTTSTLTNKTLTSPVITTPSVSGLALTDAGFTVEGSTVNLFETTVSFTDPTADRTITVPDSTGTIALSENLGNLASSNTILGNLATSNTTLGTLATSNATLGALGTANTVNLATQVAGTLDRDSFEGYNSGTGITVNNLTGAVTSNVTSAVGLPPANNIWSTSATGTAGGSFSGSTNGRYGSAMLDIGSNNNSSVSFGVTINGSGSYFWGVGGNLVTSNTMLSSGQSVNWTGVGSTRRLAGSFYVAPNGNLVLSRNVGNVTAVLRTRYQNL